MPHGNHGKLAPISSLHQCLVAHTTENRVIGYIFETEYDKKFLFSSDYLISKQALYNEANFV